MNIVAVIPARFAATRFPAKLMQLLGDQPVIIHTYLNTLATDLFTDVFVVTDSEIIFNSITNIGGKAIMSKKEHESGTDRISEAVAEMNVDVIINVQGDEPFVQKEPLPRDLPIVPITMIKPKPFEVSKDGMVEIASINDLIDWETLDANSNKKKR